MKAARDDNFALASVSEFFPPHQVQGSRLREENRRKKKNESSRLLLRLYNNYELKVFKLSALFSTGFGSFKNQPV